MLEPTVQRHGDHLLVPGLASVHSHAFQRVLRGRTQRRSSTANNFWSWRGLMFALAAHLDPPDLFAIARLAFTELAMSGVTAIGEFHYLHHDRHGQPYANRLKLAETMIAAAEAVGVRITLIRAAYLRAGFQQEAESGQLRFLDETIAQAIADTEALRLQFADSPLVRVGVAAHSVRAVPIEAIIELVAYARVHRLPFHIHLAEQRRELTECQDEYATTPVALLMQHGLLDERLVAIHATHLNEREIAALGTARCFIGLCRSTERDLGDGTPPLPALLAAGARLCFGVDSHASPDAFDEIRAAELDQRSHAEARHVAAEAPALLDAATRQGYAAIGWESEWQADQVWLNANDPALVGSDDALLPDAVVFGATPRAVERVVVNGQAIVERGVHRSYDEARAAYLQTLQRLRL